ncbi:hypothetical protein CEK26_003667 [Fusarium fujikuroi]|nr:hypothetical protein CEK27_003659 [Fusarium fujikuroi]QGJ02223.1 hypothetical protein CEK26_003667 [Fusarium fujikuroi]
MASHSAPTMEVQKLLEMLRLDGSKKRIADPGQPSDIGLKTLPTELVVKIATALHPVDRASLAFTSSWLHRIIGNALKLNRFDRSEFLRRLELDGMWLSAIFCEICQKFHEPRKSRDFTPREARRACVKYGDPKLEEKSFCHYLQDIHFDIMAALSRSSRFRHKATAESDFTAQTTYYPDDPENPRVRVEQTIYYSGEDHILIKSQRTLFTGESTGRDLLGILNRARTLSRIIHDAPELWAVCPHASWTELYPFLFRPDDEFKWRRGQWSFRKRSIQDFLPGRALQQCLWTHKDDCWTNCEARSRLDSCLNGRIWSCGGCSTDYAINIIRSERSYNNYIVMTSWKDFGKCMDREDPVWKEHMQHTIHVGHRRSSYGNIAEHIEEVIRGPNEEAFYLPDPYGDERDL